MKDLSFGLAATLAGMGVTLLTLYLLTLLVHLLNKLFPEVENKGGKNNDGSAGR